jgi:hypothetical protein
LAKNIGVIGILWLVYGAYQAFTLLLVGGIYFLMGAGMGAVGASEGEDEMVLMGGIFAISALAVVVIGGVFMIPPFAAGVGLYRKQPWGKIAGFIAAALAVLSVPLGTVLAIVTIIALIDPKIDEELNGGLVGAD